MMPEQEIATREKQQVQGTEQTRPGRYFVPDVDIREYDDALRLWAVMPGVSANDVSIILKDCMLTITGTVSTASYERLAPLYTEYNVGNGPALANASNSLGAASGIHAATGSALARPYVRQFTLNEQIDESHIKARMKNGVLEVELPKREQAKPRRIEVSAN